MAQSRAARRWRTTNEIATSFASKIPTITKPSNDGVQDFMSGATRSIPGFVKLWPILLGSDNDVLSMRVIGWHSVLLDGKTPLWFPSILGEFVCTASAAVGIAGAAVLNTERFADTITMVAARNEDSLIGAGTAIFSETRVLSPVNDTPAHIILPLRGFELYELTSDETTGAPEFNCLYSLIEDLD